jgi:hypothetical protein
VNVLGADNPTEVDWLTLAAGAPFVERMPELDEVFAGAAIRECNELRDGTEPASLGAPIANVMEIAAQGWSQTLSSGPVDRGTDRAEAHLTWNGSRRTPDT